MTFKVVGVVRGTKTGLVIQSGNNTEYCYVMYHSGLFRRSVSLFVFLVSLPSHVMTGLEAPFFSHLTSQPGYSLFQVLCSYRYFLVFFPMLMKGTNIGVNTITDT